MTDIPNVDLQWIARHIIALREDVATMRDDIAVLGATTSDRHMPAEEFCAKLEMLGITKDAAPHVLGISRSMVYRYANGEWPVPGPVAKLIDAILRHHLTMRQV